MLKFEFAIKFWWKNMYNEGYILTLKNDQILPWIVTKILNRVIGGTLEFQAILKMVLSNSRLNLKMELLIKKRVL